MQVGTLAVQHLFEKDVHYAVPLYQRPYVWTEEEQWRPLWEDIRSLAESVAKGKPTRAHFMGASVQDQPPMPPGQIETRIVIDGQQRLTTLQLLLKAFRDIVKARGNEPYTKALDKLIRNNHPLSTQIQQQMKVWPTNSDQDDYRAVMTAEDRTSALRALGARASKRRLRRNIPDAYLFFGDEINDWLSEDASRADERIAGLYSAIRDNVRLVVIDLDERDDAQMIFETLNARGTPLLAADLVKNSLLSEVQRESGNVDQAYRDYWHEFDSDAGFWRERVGRGHAQRARIETFLQHALTLLTGSIVSASHLYAAYRDYARSDKAGSAINRLTQFKTYGAIFKRLQGEQDNPRIERFFYRLRTLDVVTAWPFILALYERFEDNQKVLETVLADLESFLVRRMVCRLSTRGYGDLFGALTATLVDQPESEVSSAIRHSLLKGTAEADRWPMDDEFKAAWISNPLYENLTRPRVRMLLEAMEEALRSQFAESRAVSPGLTIEHVMPRGWRENWPLPEGRNANDRDKAIHTLGNLTLLNNKLNPYQSNRPWIDAAKAGEGKREALKNHSVLFLNKDLWKFDNWDEKRIEQRSNDLFVHALKVWPRATARS